MAPIPQWLLKDVSSGTRAGTSTSGPPNASANGGSPSRVFVEKFLPALLHAQTRECALQLLCKIRGDYKDLAPLLWHSFGTVSTLLKEIIAVYPLLSTPNLTENASNTVCNALALLECVASHQDTRMLFVKANMPLYLFPFLSTRNKERPHECLRLTSLLVIGALMKGILIPGSLASSNTSTPPPLQANDAENINFLINNGIFAQCLSCMKVGSLYSKIAATTIVAKLLMSDAGLKHCSSARAFYEITGTLGKMVDELAEKSSRQLLKHIICCYIRLCESPRACDGLGICLPRSFRDTNFTNIFRDDPSTMMLLQKLFYIASTGHLCKLQPAWNSLEPFFKD